MRLKTLFALLFTLPAWGVDRYLVDTRYSVLQARTDEQIHTAAWETGEELALRLAARGSFSGLTFKGFDYSANVTYAPLSWVSAMARLTHGNRFGDPHATTVLATSLKLEGRFPFFLSYFAELGGYWRLYRGASNAALPNFLRPSFTESDLLFAVGLRVHPSPTWTLTTQLASLEYFDVYNLNHCFVEIASQWKLPGWQLGAYLRYQSLLGFGLRDAWVAGLSATF